MLELFISPGKYVSGFDIIDDIGVELEKLGKKILLVFDEKLEVINNKIENSLKKNGINFTVDYFRGECCEEEIHRIKRNATENKVEVVFGAGGGKLLDTIKAAGYYCGAKIATMPTIAATCAAWSSHSAVYTREGESSEYLSIEKNPELVFVDKKVILDSPIRYTKAGIVDTLAKWVETSSFTAGIEQKSVELEIAISLAKKSFDELLECGEKAVIDIEKGQFSKEVDRVIEHVILTAGLVGGIGGEACRAVAAHAVNNGFTVLAEKYNMNLHGEVVGFGNVVQLILDGKDQEEVKTLTDFYKKIGVNLSLSGLGFELLPKEIMNEVIEKSLKKSDTMWNLPYEVDFKMVYDAIIKADSLLTI